MFRRFLMLAVLLLGTVFIADAAELPGGLAGIQEGDIYVAFRISRADLEGMAVYFAACKRNYVESDNLLPPAPPAGSDDLALLNGTSRYSTIGKRIADTTAFRLEWELEVTTMDGTPKALSLQMLKNSLPDEFAVEVFNSSSENVLTWSDNNGSFNAAPGIYTIVMEVAMRDDVECVYELQPGWNLLNIPLTEVTDAGNLFEYEVRDWKRMPVDKADKLLAGNCFWVRNGGEENVRITISGRAYLNRKPALAESDSTWKCVGVIGQYNASTGALDAGDVAVKGWTWDAGKQAFVPVAEKAKATRAYILK